MINQMQGQSQLRVKQHFDFMVSILLSITNQFFLKKLLIINTIYFNVNTNKLSIQKRATIRTQEYFYHQISNTPFSLGIALPRDYGRYRVDGKTEVLLETPKGLNGKLKIL